MVSLIKMFHRMGIGLSLDVLVIVLQISVVSILPRFVSVQADTQHQLNSNSTVNFEWRVTGWSDCDKRDAGSCCGSCHRVRQVACYWVEAGVQVPPFYCTKHLTSRPKDKEDCSPCRQNCVLSTWAEWSQCAASCGPTSRFRTRQVLLPPSGGGSDCGTLGEVEECIHLPLCSFLDPRPQYQWRVGSWSSCRKVCT
jgi:hypothetical protein